MADTVKKSRFNTAIFSPENVTNIENLRHESQIVHPDSLNLNRYVMGTRLQTRGGKRIKNASHVNTTSLVVVDKTSSEEWKISGGGTGKDCSGGNGGGNVEWEGSEEETCHEKGGKGQIGGDTNVGKEGDCRERGGTGEKVKKNKSEEESSMDGRLDMTGHKFARSEKDSKGAKPGKGGRKIGKVGGKSGKAGGKSSHKLPTCKFHDLDMSVQGAQLKTMSQGRLPIL